ncbi:unnamed protein product [Closterium sp. Naga37s-1]|nr:unnamed protein product [Closterium sp. Naga37s-1]
MVSESGAPPGRAADTCPVERAGQRGEGAERTLEHEEAPQMEPVPPAAPRGVVAEEPAETGVAAEASAAAGTAAAAGGGSASSAAMDSAVPPPAEEQEWAEEQERAEEQGHAADTRAAAVPMPVAAAAAESSEEESQAPSPAAAAVTEVFALETTPGGSEGAGDVAATVGPAAAAVQHEDQGAAGDSSDAVCTETTAAAEGAETQEHAQVESGTQAPESRDVAHATRDRTDGARGGGTTGARGAPRGRRGGRGSTRGGRVTMLGGEAAVERTGTWQERHDRPDRVPVPANREEAASDNSKNGSEFMPSRSETSEEVSLDAEEIQRAGFGGRGRRAGAANGSRPNTLRAGVAGEAPRQPSEKSPADLAKDDSIWQLASTWDISPLQRMDQPFLVRRMPPKILESYTL